MAKFTFHCGIPMLVDTESRMKLDELKRHLRKLDELWDYVFGMRRDVVLCKEGPLEFTVGDLEEIIEAMQRAK